MIPKYATVKLNTHTAPINSWNLSPASNHLQCDHHSFSCPAVCVIARQHQLCTRTETLAQVLLLNHGQSLHFGDYEGCEQPGAANHKADFCPAERTCQQIVEAHCLAEFHGFLLPRGNSIVVTKPYLFSCCCQSQNGQRGWLKSCFNTPLSTSQRKVSLRGW